MARRLRDNANVMRARNSRARLAGAALSFKWAPRIEETNQVTPRQSQVSSRVLPPGRVCGSPVNQPMSALTFSADLAASRYFGDVLPMIMATILAGSRRQMLREPESGRSQPVRRARSTTFYLGLALQKGNQMMGCASPEATPPRRTSVWHSQLCP